MKPKPFWLLNHFTVPVFMGAPYACVLWPREDTAGLSRLWREGRQSGALFAARPSRSAEKLDAGQVGIARALRKRSPEPAIAEGATIHRSALHRPRRRESAVFPGGAPLPPFGNGPPLPICFSGSQEVRK
jgi:hypothetical protein